ncbi:alpha-glucosidase/alpha-galactosidase (plasmid) [Phaeobacter inhibens]|uniref:alpha-glucosidase/alpha-galactosidase n=1 Tax=Phaeobacter inhibens TaxID=221822 RepID=UPI000971A78A|nr:alpha-glucosidase/alpha-galactosidase [Phaeobacter inhibens]APX18036.1 alpha-glucosidase/alpha-galactosidase [Phaeobacter inhibens]
MSEGPKIAFIGAGSTIFMKNLIGDILSRPDLGNAHIALMDLHETRLTESRLVAEKMIATLGVPAALSTHNQQRAAIADADFVVCAFQIGGYDPCTITDFEVPKRFGLRQTIADTLGVGGIMRGLRTVPHLWTLCEDMSEVCPDAVLLQYANPMAINTWAIAARYPKIRQVGLCHSVQETAAELALDLGIPLERIRYRSAGINHVAFMLDFDEVLPNGSLRNLYPDLRDGYAAGRIPGLPREMPRCPNRVRYEVMKHIGYFVTESSEHFAEYVPWFIKRDRLDLIENFGIPLDEYPKRCVEQSDDWKQQAETLRRAERIEVTPTHEYASSVVHSVWTGTPSVIHGNVANHGLIPGLPEGAAVEVPCLVDRNGIQPTVVSDIPLQLLSVMRSNVNVQELTVHALLNEDRESVYHAAMMDPHTAAELDLDQIRALIDALIDAHGDWLPAWLRTP